MADFYKAGQGPIWEGIAITYRRYLEEIYFRVGRLHENIIEVYNTYDKSLFKDLRLNASHLDSYESDYMSHPVYLDKVTVAEVGFSRH